MLYMGIDGGASKTEGVVCDEHGTVLTHCLGGSTNPNDIGFRKAAENLKKTVATLLETVPSVDAAFAGLSGYLNNRERLDPLFSKLFAPSVKVRCDSDIVNLLTCGLGSGDGCGVVSGTGSCCFVRQADNYTRIGGWGYLLDGAGGGYDIGRDALSAALRAYDGLGEQTLLSDLIETHSGSRAENHLTEIYAGGKTYIASFAPLVFEAAANGDLVASNILERNYAYIAECIDAASKLLDGPFQVVLGGGLFGHFPVTVDIIKHHLKTERAQLTPLQRAPVFGAVLEAMRL